MIMEGDMEMTIDEKKFEELPSKEPKFTLKLKTFWENYRKNWLWINIGGYLSGLLFIWFLFFKGIFSLWISILVTIVIPLGIFLRSKIKLVKHPIMINKIWLIGIVGFLITDVFWLLSMYLLFTAPWAPIDQNQIPHWEGYSIFAVIFVGIYVIVGYFLYRFGEKREWHIPPCY